MKIQKAIWKETVHIAEGVVVLSVLMQLVFLLIGKWDMTVLYGTLLGSAYAILNFFILGLTVQKVANEGNEKQGKNWMQFSYSCRMMGTMLVVFMGLSMPWFNWVAVFLPQLFPRITIAAMGFTGKKALEWKLKYIAAFNQMERIIVQRQTVEWKDARLLGKQARREETDEIKRLVCYAEAQGSKHADMLYANYSRLVKKSLDMDSRDTADALTLSRAAEMERIIRRAIKTGMKNQMEYKAIYRLAKEKIAAYREMVLLPA